MDWNVCPYGNFILVGWQQWQKHQLSNSSSKMCMPSPKKLNLSSCGSNVTMAMGHLFWMHPGCCIGGIVRHFVLRDFNLGLGCLSRGSSKSSDAQRFPFLQASMRHGKMREEDTSGSLGEELVHREDTCADQLEHLWIACHGTGELGAMAYTQLRSNDCRVWNN